MATTFDTIHTYALVSIRDFRLDKLYVSSLTDFKTLMDSYLVKSTIFFTNCLQDLTDVNLTSRQFNKTLTLPEQIILANLEIMVWLDSQVFDVRQMSLMLTDTDFKTFSAAQNLTAKINAQNMWREKVNQDMTNYELKNANWAAWETGNFI